MSKNPIVHIHPWNDGYCNELVVWREDGRNSYTDTKSMSRFVNRIVFEMNFEIDCWKESRIKRGDIDVYAWFKLKESE